MFVTHFQSLIAGGVAGACSRTLVAPFERLKIMFQVRRQIDDYYYLILDWAIPPCSFPHSEVQGHPPVYTSVGQGLQKIYLEEGLRGFFRGNGVNVIRIFPTSAIQYFSFDQYKRVRGSLD